MFTSVFKVNGSVVPFSLWSLIPDGCPAIPLSVINNTNLTGASRVLCSLNNQQIFVVGVRRSVNGFMVECVGKSFSLIGIAPVAFISVLGQPKYRQHTVI